MALTLVVMRHGERLDQHLRDGGAPNPAPAASAELPLGRDMDGRALVAGDRVAARRSKGRGGTAGDVFLPARVVRVRHAAAAAAEASASAPPPPPLPVLDLVFDGGGEEVSGVAASNARRVGASLAAGADADARWPDRPARPHDTPLADLSLPAAAARALAAGAGTGAGTGGAARRREVRAISSSPFRRALQTAGACARALGLRSVRVSSALGEDARAVRRLLERAAAADALLGGDVRAAAASRLGEDEMRAALGEGVALELDERDAANDAAAPPFEETGEEAEARFEAALQAEAARFAAEHAVRSGSSGGGTLLVVSHGLCVEVASHVGGSHAAAIPVCGWVELAADGGRGRGLLASGGGVVLGEAGGAVSPAELPARGGGGAGAGAGAAP